MVYFCMNLDFQRQEFRSPNKQLLSLECETARLKTSINFRESQQQICSINSVGKSRMVVVELLVMVSMVSVEPLTISSSGSRWRFRELVVIVAVCRLIFRLPLRNSYPNAELVGVFRGTATAFGCEKRSADNEKHLCSVAVSSTYAVLIISSGGGGGGGHERRSQRAHGNNNNNNDHEDDE